PANRWVRSVEEQSETRAGKPVRASDKGLTCDRPAVAGGSPALAFFVLSSVFKEPQAHRARAHKRSGGARLLPRGAGHSQRLREADGNHIYRLPTRQPHGPTISRRW